MARQLAKSRIGVKCQTVVPKPVREALQLRPGDEIGYVIEDGRVEIVKARREQDNPFACFTEWSSDADAKGYATL